MGPMVTLVGYIIINGSSSGEEHVEGKQVFMLTCNDRSMHRVASRTVTVKSLT